MYISIGSSNILIIKYRGKNVSFVKWNWSLFAHCNNIYKDDKKKISILELEHPESIAKYEKTNRNVEKYSKIIAIFCKNVIGPLITFPIVVHSLFVYFTTDSGMAAFELPLPMWWDFRSFLTNDNDQWNIILNCSIFLS